MRQPYLGLDYGMGSTNVDTQTGIRYGCISQHSISQAWADSSEAEYPCSNCDCDAGYADSCEADPTGWNVNDGQYQMVDCLDSDVLVLKSPFYTFGPFCSPCVPGAVNLNDAGQFCENDAPVFDESCLPRAYCPGHDWFDNSVAPYPVFGVTSNRLCFPDAWYGHDISFEDAAHYGTAWYGHAFFAMPAYATDYCS